MSEAGPSHPLRASTASSGGSSIVDKPLPRPQAHSPTASRSATSASATSTSASTGGRRRSSGRYSFGQLQQQYGGLGLSNGAGPRVPRDPLKRVSAGSAASSSTHSRRPSRAERFEAIVDAARNVLRRGERDMLTVSPQEWLDTCYSLLKVIDGMSKQLATHDELAAQLKIAQSNLTLAETHSEFLEETLRRRGSTDQSSVTSSLALAATHSATGAKRSATVTGVRVSETLKGLGLEAAGDLETPKPSFFSRLPSSRRKNTTSVQSTASGTWPLAPSSSDSTELPKSVEGLTAEVFQLRSLVHNLEAACKNWQSGSETLSKTNEELVRQVVELEKTNNDLMEELENLSMELFQEANTMVAEERKARARAETETATLRTELTGMSSEIERLRRELDDGGLEGVRRAEEELEKALRVNGPRISNVPLIGSSPSSPPLDATTARSAAEDDASKKWYNFGRTISGKRHTPSPLPSAEPPVTAESISNPVLVSSTMPSFVRSDTLTPKVGERPSHTPPLVAGAAFQPLKLGDSIGSSAAGGQSPASFSGRSDASTTGAFHTPPLAAASPNMSSNSFDRSPSSLSAPTMVPSLSSTSSGSSSAATRRIASRPTALDLQTTAKRTPQDIIAEEQRKNRSPMSPNDARWREKAGSLATTPVSPLMPASATMPSSGIRKAHSTREHTTTTTSSERLLSAQQQQQQQQQRGPILRSNSYDQRPSQHPSTHHKSTRPSTGNDGLRVNTTTTSDQPRPFASGQTFSAGGAYPTTVSASSSGRLSPYLANFPASSSVSSNLSSFSATSGRSAGRAGEDLEKLMKSIEDMDVNLFSD